ncbi:AfsR/SARP family transcriptional regulator [Streptodolium elevatio]|uniref:BTAD domain-containing putative transcriptional regulator n=1 Tax=Streptodolium elevatio TaxID=3157996 RepID=A0ABV3DH34_9ACTN
MTGEIRFAVLGPVRAWRDNSELRTGAPQQQAVLAALLLREGAQVSTSGLIDAVWGSVPPRSAAATVRTYIYRLRQSLDDGGERLIASISDGYALRLGTDALDLARCHAWLARSQAAREEGGTALAAVCLREALALWAGTPLAGVPGQFAASWRAALADLRLALTEELLSLELELGRHVRAAAELSALVAENPLRERLRELHVLALYSSGRQAAALAALEDFRHLLRDELGVDPGPGLRRVQRIVLTGQQTYAETFPATCPAPPAPALPAPLPEGPPLPPSGCPGPGRCAAAAAAAAAPGFPAVPTAQPTAPGTSRSAPSTRAPAAPV